MDTDPGAHRRDGVVDWLAAHPDLPHLFAHLSELVHRFGYAPGDLVVVPRSEVDRRETAAFTAGWAEAVSDELPRIRREYEKRVADAYAQGQEDARGIRRPQRRSSGGTDGARVIALPFARLLEPPAVVVEVEERVRRERESFERRAEPAHEQEADAESFARPDAESVQRSDVESVRRTDAESVQRSDAESVRRPGAEAVPEAGPGREAGPVPEPELEHQKEPEPDLLVTAQESRARRNGLPVRKVVRGKGGRPIVPPLAGVPHQAQAGGERRPADPAEAESRTGRARSLSDRARALEEELAAERAQEAPPEPVP
ncbi:hypothetical protein [Streptomyces sp. NPDC014656]|uniref:hypothetical protein n=1 Tax=Streptomyces sp. NPDC014656 TaxID=3364878 RepID=UPI0036F4D20B